MSIKNDQKVSLTVELSTAGQSCNSMRTFEKYLYDHLHFFGDEGYVQADDIELSFSEDKKIAIYKMQITPLGIWFLARSYQNFCNENKTNVK